MSRVTDEKKIEERYLLMLKYQDEIKPFTPTMRELMKLWGLKSTSNVDDALNNLIARGYVISREQGGTRKKHEYYAVRNEVL